MRKIFISYDKADEAFAIQLATELRDSGANAWIDVMDADPGRNWSRSIERALADAHMLLVILSPAALACAHVNVEWQAYLEARRPVIPVLAARCDPPGPLRTRRPVDFTRNHSRAFHDLVARLLEYGTRIRRIDPVIWTLAEDVQDFRDEQAATEPPSTSTPSEDDHSGGESGTSELSDPLDLVENGIRRMVKGLRDILRSGDQ
ncbi:MAG: toll/interleukin-1 receptor domain-containing protein [Chloroflexi bacterium]|nr:toll/interleukin-1 receptor domain-containing protein [Chloroflexota bacterium]